MAERISLSMIHETLEAFALRRLQKGEARLPRTWSSIRTYERLIEKGLAVEVEDQNPLLRTFALKSELASH